MDRSAPVHRSQRVIDRQRIIGDLIPYQNDGKNCSAIVGKVERA
jgi:hypothetical protein